MQLNKAFEPKNSMIEGAVDDFLNNGVGIVHFGVGAFHRAHMAVYTHAALKMHGGDWRILGVSLQSTKIAKALNAQDGIYSLTQRGTGEPIISLIKSIAKMEAATLNKDVIFEYLSSAQTRIVSMSVTEKAYGILREEGKVDLTHASIANDVANPDNPIGIIGMIVKGLKMRKALGLKPFTVLCCDNLPQNGDLVRKGVLDFALQINEPELAKWIEGNGAFPNSMVDRITPATTPNLLEEVEAQLGAKDTLPVESEVFSQWVIEDNFCDGRPKWEDVGTIFVKEVAPYEHMKLRMLNGTHSLIAYLGYVSGHKFVRDVMEDSALRSIVKNYMSAAAKTLSPIENIDFATYAADLIERFDNPHIAHETYQIAMDGSQKMPQRIFEAAVDSLRQGHSIEPFALGTASWIYFCAAEHAHLGAYTLRDPQEEALMRAYKEGDGNADKICELFYQLPDLFPSELINSDAWKIAVSNYLNSMIALGA
ncbi:MAG: mannitol dehydrogenase family protein, partial [Nitratireductor sp.]